MAPGKMSGMLRRGRALGLPAFTYEDWLLLCFVLGVLSGTALSLTFGGLAVQGAVLGMASGGRLKGAAGRESFLPVLRLRAAQTGMGWLAGLTVCSRLLFGLLTFGSGMCLSAALSLLTIEKGLLGIAAFLLSVFPQFLFYILIWYILSRWAWQREKKMHLPGGMFLLMLSAAGAYIEAFAAPYLAGLIR